MRYVRRICLLSVAALLGLAGCSACWAWGPTGHTIVTQHALPLMPGELTPFYDANSRYVVALATLPDDWKQTHHDEERPDHYINLDLLDKPPFEHVATDRATVEAHFGKEAVVKAGLLPWTIEARYEKLVKAFREKDTVGVVVQSALLAHYVADAHVPMHATKNYDGDKPEQKGIHFRWEEGLVALTLKPEEVRTGSAERISDPLKSAFGWCIEAHKLNAPIFRADDRAREIDPNYGYRYHKSLFEYTGTILTSRLAHAAEALAGIYIAAWEEAGRPEMPATAAPLFWGE